MRHKKFRKNRSHTLRNIVGASTIMALMLTGCSFVGDKDEKQADKPKSVTSTKEDKSKDKDSVETKDSKETQSTEHKVNSGYETRYEPQVGYGSAGKTTYTIPARSPQGQGIALRPIHKPVPVKVDSPELIAAKAKEKAAWDLFTQLNADLTILKNKLAKALSDKDAVYKAADNAKAAYLATQKMLEDARLKAASDNDAAQMAYEKAVQKLDEKKALKENSAEKLREAESKLENLKAVGQQLTEANTQITSRLRQAQAELDTATNNRDITAAALNTEKQEAKNTESNISAKEREISELTSRIDNYPDSVATTIDWAKLDYKNPADQRIIEEAMEAMMASYYNEYRRQAGLPEIMYNTKLAEENYGWAKYLTDTNQFMHNNGTNNDGSVTPVRSAARENLAGGSEFLATDEEWEMYKDTDPNIHKSYPKGGLVKFWEHQADKMMRSWIASDEHKANFDSSDIGQFGFGVKMKYDAKQNKVSFISLWQGDVLSAKHNKPLVHKDSSVIFEDPSTTLGSDIKKLVNTERLNNLNDSELAEFEKELAKEKENIKAGDLFGGKYAPIPKEEKQEYKDMLKLKETKEGELATLTQMKEDLANRIENLTTQLDTDNAKVNEVTASRDAVQSELDANNTALQENKTETNATEERIADLKNIDKAIEIAQNDVDAARDNIPVVQANGEKAVQDATNKVESAKTAADKAENTKAEQTPALDEAITKARTDVDEAKPAVDKAKADADQATKERKALERVLRQIRR